MGVRQHGERLFQNFSLSHQKRTVTKERANNLDLINIKTYCSLKGTANRMKKATDWGRLFVKVILQKGFMSRKYREPFKLSIMKTNKLTRKWSSGWQISTRGDDQYH